MSGLTRWLLGLLSVCRLNTVTCQLRVEGFLGGTALLPCIYSEADPLPATVSVFWRDKDDSNVLDINKNVPEYVTQSPKFRGRVFSFPELYKKGNFSVVLKDVQQPDGGSYECNIPSVDFEQHVLLSVSGKRVEVAAATPPGPAGGSSAVTPHSLHMVLLSVPLVTRRMLR